MKNNSRLASQLPLLQQMGFSAWISSVRCCHVPHGKENIDFHNNFNE